MLKNNANYFDKTSNYVNINVVDMSKVVVSKLVNDALEITAMVGDVVNFKITILNDNDVAILNKMFFDTLDIKLQYVVGSFKVNSVVTVPTIAGQTIKYTIPNLSANGSVIIEFQATILP